MERIINANIILPEAIIEKGCVEIQDGRITAVYSMGQQPKGSPNCTVTDAGGCFLAPGFIDIHVHGGGGADFMDNAVDAYLTIAETHARYGTTAMLPTTLTSENSHLLKTFSVYEKALAANTNGARFYGLHLEGPYFAMEQRGAQDPRFVRNPDPTEYRPILQKYGHLITRWSAAPELPGALDFGREVDSNGILVALGHTDAVYEDIVEAVKYGYRLATHLYSGMSGMHRRHAHRYAGAIESCLLLDEIDVEIIADGVHLPEPFLKLICKAKSRDQIILITDAMRAAGTDDTVSILGGKDNGLHVVVEEGVAKLPDRTSFAGSVATADRLIRVMRDVAGIELVTAVQMMTLNPAKLLKLDRQIGSIATGKQADLVLFDQDIRVMSTWVKGQTVYSF